MKLSVPRIGGVGLDYYGKTPIQLAQEVTSLPFDDIPCALTLAKKKLEVLNRVDLDGNKRAMATEPFNVAYGRFIKYYHAFFSGTRFAREVGDGELDELERFTRELAYAYKHILRSYLVLPGHDQEKGQYAYMALYYLGQSMMQSFDRYTWLNPKSWAEIHGLYAYAERKGYLGQKRYDPVNPQYTQSIGEAYTQICLTAVADPFQMNPGENWVVFAYLRRWSEHVEVVPPVSNLSRKDCFCINLNGQERPFPMGTRRLNGDANLRWLSLEKILALVEDHKSQLLMKQPPASLGLGDWLEPGRAIALLDKITHAWNKNRHRQEERKPHKEKLRIIWGMSDIYRYLDPHTRRDLMLNSGKLSLNNYSTALTADVSESGVRLKLPSTLKPQLNVGQLVLILSENGKSPRLGRICWTALGADASMLNIGMHLYRGQAKPIMIRPQSDALQERPGVLLVSYQKNRQTINSLISPTGLMETGEVVEINAPNTKSGFEVCATNRINQTGLVDQFKFKPIYH